MTQSIRHSLIDSIDLEIKKLKLQNDTLSKHLSNFLDEFEGRWDSDERCDSYEIAQQYIDAATYMQNFHGRKENRIMHVQEWMDNDLPY